MNKQIVIKINKIPSFCHKWPFLDTIDRYSFPFSRHFIIPASLHHLPKHPRDHIKACSSPSDESVVTAS